MPRRRCFSLTLGKSCCQQLALAVPECTGSSSSVEGKGLSSRPDENGANVVLWAFLMCFLCSRPLNRQTKSNTAEPSKRQRRPEMEGKKRHSLGGFAPVLELGENRPKGGGSGSLFSHLKLISPSSSIEDNRSHSLGFYEKYIATFLIEIHFHKNPLDR